MGTPREPHQEYLRLKATLVNELCELDCVRDPALRFEFGQSVGEYLGRHVDLPGRDARSDMVVLLNTALPQRDRGFDAVIYAVALHSGEDIAAEVRARVHGLAPVLPDQDAGVARKLLREAAVPRPALHAALTRALNLDTPEHLSAADLFDHLLDVPAQPDGLPPAVLLLECAAQLAATAQATRLRDWCEAWAGGAGAVDALHERRRRLAADRTPDHTIPKCLVVMVDPADDGSPDIFVRHWINELPGYWDPRSGESETTTLDGLAGAVERAIGQGERLWADLPEHDVDPAYVEFVLPYSLLNHDVARLEIGADTGDPLPIGPRYLVHLRSLERMRDRNPIQHRAWRARWKTLRQGPVTQAHHWWAADPAELPRWRQALFQNDRLTAVTMDAPATEGHGLEALKAAIAEGIGLALWDRRPASHPNIREMMRLLIGFPHAQLPRAVLHMRIQAETDVDGLHQLGRNIALFWDDPFRLIDCEEVPA
ncbi:hypothetical protein E1265_21720 [Streptomyces sp. 8K308]|uniref:VMAP-C domain-containing protein n=1 Tax=Streptomyces sp. 8K308 TaxID=2530388 RepID=UPI0010467C1C|nr:hypothetical protein [Streptomyces sp. 8K308]TDC20556.1 hypothetical protein E1265_21720 [Streptomyces sp. 8K308]